MSEKKDFYITEQPQLQEVISLIKAAKLVALDTEFTRQTTYYPILSIIQIAVKDSEGKQKTFIVDCETSLDLKDLYEVIASPKIGKILHSATQDLQIFNQKSDLTPKAIFDTQIMANFCGFGFNVGYSSLVEKIFGKILDKKQQRSDWQKRPLSSKQIEYALLDVVFLEEIYEKFLEILQQKNRLNWYIEEIENFITKTLTKSEGNLSRDFSLRNISTENILKIRELVSWREEWARKLDLPRQHFIRDEVIAGMVSAGGITKSAASKLSDEMQIEVMKIINSKPEISERGAKFWMTQKQKDSFDEAKKIIAKVARDENFQEQFLLTSQDLKKIICDDASFDEIITGWRKELFGAEIKKIISKN